MKTGKIFGLLTILVLCASIVIAGDTPWFDMKNCAVCKSFTSKPGLMEHMNQSYYKISNGAIGVVTVDDPYKAPFKSAVNEMNAVFQKVNNGQKVTLDGYCTTYNQLVKDGAKVENIETPSGTITIITSTDAKLVTRIQKFAQKTNDEILAMAKPAVTKTTAPIKK